MLFFYQPLLCCTSVCSPQFQRQRLPSIFISLPQKTVFSYYFILFY